jgi:hypothetical protein
MKINVVQVHKADQQSKKFVYCGRGNEKFRLAASPLSNPFFSLRRKRPRAGVCRAHALVT